MGATVPNVLAVNVTFLVLCWVSISLRVFVRTMLVKGWGWDDYLAVAALPPFTLYSAVLTVGFGTGAIQYTPAAFKWYWVSELAYIATTCIIRASISIFILRISLKKRQRLTTMVVLATSLLAGIICFALILFQCSPISNFWTRFAGVRGTCMKSYVTVDILYAYSTVSVCADWTLAILPVFVIWELQLNPRTKVSVVLILAFGVIGSLATIARFPHIKQLTDGNFASATANLAVWSIIEMGSGITASAMATLKPLFKAFLSRSHLYRKNSTAKAWPLPRKHGHAGYLRRSCDSAVHNVKDSNIRVRDKVVTGVTTVAKGTSHWDLEDAVVVQSISIWRDGNVDVLPNNSDTASLERPRKEPL